MIEIISTERQKITDQEAAEAVNTIRQYCKSKDIHKCVFDGVLRPVCEECFTNSTMPQYWQKVVLPGDEEDEP